MPRSALLELVEREADADLVREMLAFAVERKMEMEIEAKTLVVVIHEAYIRGIST